MFEDQKAMDIWDDSNSHFGYNIKDSNPKSFNYVYGKLFQKVLHCISNKPIRISGLNVHVTDSKVKYVSVILFVFSPNVYSDIMGNR